MQRFIAITLSLSMLLFTVTLSGMAFFGMMMDHPQMESDTCMADKCDAVDCLNQCISSATVVVTQPQLFVLAFLGVLIPILFFSHAKLIFHLDRLSLRLREGIGKLFFQQQLATIVLRN